MFNDPEGPRSRKSKWQPRGYPLPPPGAAYPEIWKVPPAHVTGSREQTDPAAGRILICWGTHSFGAVGGISVSIQAGWFLGKASLVTTVAYTSGSYGPEQNSSCKE